MQQISSTQLAEFWKGVETKSAEKEATPELSKGTVNAEKKKSKEELWSTSLSDDSWYRAPQFHPEVIKDLIFISTNCVHRGPSQEEQILRFCVRLSMHMGRDMMMEQQPLVSPGFLRFLFRRI